MLKKWIAALLALLLLVPLAPTAFADDTEADDTLPDSFRHAYTHQGFSFDTSYSDYFASVLLFNPESEDVLFEKNSEVAFACGGGISMLMSVQVALQYLNPFQTVSVTEETLSGTFTKSIGLTVGQTPRVVELIAAMFLCEAQDAAAVLSDAVVTKAGGQSMSGDKLILMTALMNEEAERLKMTGTEYRNALGSYVSGQVTTASDTVRLLYALYKNADYGALIGNTDYLIGCLEQGSFDYVQDANDPRNRVSPAYDRNISGYAFHSEGKLCAMALSKQVVWQTSGDGGINGKLFLVAVSTEGASVSEALKLLTQGEDNFAIVYYRRLFQYLMQGKSCPYCNGTYSEHTDGCTIPALDIGLTDAGRLYSVDTTMFSLLTELYANNNFNKFSIEYVTGSLTTTPADRLALGDAVIDVTVNYNGAPFLTETMYATKLKTAADGDELVYNPTSETTNTSGVKWQVILIFGLAVPIILAAVIITLVVRKRMKML